MHSNKPQPTKASSNKTLIILIALAVLGGGAFVIFRTKDEPVEVDTKRAGNIKGEFSGGVTKSTVNAKPVASRGAFAADETIQLIGSSGSIAIVMEIPDPKSPAGSDTSRFFSMIGAEVDAFKKRMKEKGRFTFLPELKLVHPDGASRTVWPAGGFAKFLQQTPATATVVAFCLPPAQISDAEKAMLRSRSGKLIINAGGVSDVKPYLNEGLVDLAVTAKMPIPPAPSSGSEAPDQWARRVHEVLKR